MYSQISVPAARRREASPGERISATRAFVGMSKSLISQRVYRALSILAFGLLSVGSGLASERTGSDVWSIPYPAPFDSSQLVRPQSAIRVEKNGFVDESGVEFVFRGVSIADPAKLVDEGRWTSEIFAVVAEWGANTVRVPIHPPAWRGLGPERYLELIDEAVVWANQLGLYLIIDWHSIGYLPTEQYQHVMYDTTKKETLGFWRTIAFRYEGVPTIAVYEIFNEPTTQGNTLGIRDWQEWKTFNEYVIDMIYARDTAVIPLVAGFDWAYDLRDVRTSPVQRDGIAYSVHPYPQKAKPKKETREEFFRLWQETWGFVSETYPMIASELGWVREDGYGAHIPVINDGSYGPMIMDFLQQRGISWIAWAFDPKWSPVLITDWEFNPSEQGRFFRDAMKKAKETRSNDVSKE